MAQLVEHHLAKVGVAAEACKAFTPGSNPGVASNYYPEMRL